MKAGSCCSLPHKESVVCHRRIEEIKYTHQFKSILHSSLLLSLNTADEIHLLTYIFMNVPI